MTMPKTTRERQAAYRSRRQDGDGEYRLNTWLSSQASFALRCLARHQRLSRRAVLEQLVIGADQAILDSLDLDTPEWDLYLGVTR
jgi:hypothetical protein